MRKTVISSLAAALGVMLLMTACSSIDGTYNENQLPSVAFVNNQQDADAVAQSYDIADYTFIFPDVFQGFEEDEAGQLPANDDLGVEAKFELIRYQYFNVLSIESISEYNPESGETLLVPSENYRLDNNIARYLWLQHTEAFQWQLGRSYIIDGVFEYRPVHSFAPLVFWQGSDPDGFVEGYRFLDHAYEDEDALAAISAQVATNDASLVWVETLNTQATVNLTTELGRIQKHVLFVQAYDDKGAVSPAAMRVFNRSNRAPNTPSLSYHKDGYTRISQPEEYEKHVVSWMDIETDINYIADLEDNVSLYYEVPMSEVPLTNWNGMRFLVSGDDPDDQALVTIPLQFQYILHSIPADSVETWMNPEIAESLSGLPVLEFPEAQVMLDETNVVSYDPEAFDVDAWTDANQLELFNLESGFYQLTVFTRDDGLEPCAEPAWMRFKVQKATFEKDLLLLNVTPNGSSFLGFDSDEDYVQYHMDLATESITFAKTVNGVPDFEARWKADVAEGDDYNCRYWKIDEDEDFPYLLPYSVLSQYHTIVVIDDKWASGTSGGNPLGERLRNPAKGFFMDYLDMGGSMFWTGYSSLIGSFGFTPGSATLSQEMVATNGGDFLGLYMGIQGVYGDINTSFFLSRGDACMSGIPEYAGASALEFDPARVAALRQNASFNMFYHDSANPQYRSPAPDSSLIYLEAFALNESIGSYAAYTYDSYSAGLEDETTFEFFKVAGAGNLPNIFYEEDDTNYPGESPWHLDTNIEPGVDGCWLYISVQNFYDVEIFRAMNAYNVSREDSTWANPTRLSRALVGAGERIYVYVNYQTGEPWTVGDDAFVDVQWQPILEKHRKPVVCYTESIGFASTVGESFSPLVTNFRTSFSALPMHVLKLGELPTEFDQGEGARSIMAGVLFQFFRPKLQDVTE
jgi:hypothetical protein